MKKVNWLHSWSRLLLWSHVLGVIGFYIALWIRTAPKEIKRAKASSDCKPDPHNAKPGVSIILPARNEERNIRRCVTSLLEQDCENCRRVGLANHMRFIQVFRRRMEIGCCLLMLIPGMPPMHCHAPWRGQLRRVATCSPW